MGTRFIPTVESLASEDYKNMLIESDLDDIIYTDAFSGVNANYLKPSIERAGFDPEHLEKKGTVDFSKMNETGPKAWKDIWSAGHGVGQIRKVQTVQEVVAELKREYEEAVGKIS